MKKFIKENWFKILVVVIVIVLFTLASKFLIKSKNTTDTQIANPASVNCIKNGGKLSIADKTEGQVGMCTFSDGTVCEEWAYLRGECPKRQIPPTVVEDVGNELQKVDLIRLDNPRPGQTISSPLAISGQARGTWFFEASFPVILTDWDGKIIAQGIAQAKNDWMTTEFVPFEATLTFTVDTNTYSNKGSLILKKDNPSGLPQNDDALEIPIVFGIERRP